MKHLLFFLLSISVSALASAQSGVAISSTGAQPHSSAMLDIQSSERGLLVPRMSYAEISAMNNPAEGLIVQDTARNILYCFTDGTWLPCNSDINIPDSIISFHFTESIDDIVAGEAIGAGQLVMLSSSGWIKTQIDTFITGKPAKLLGIAMMSVSGAGEKIRVGLSGYVYNDTLNLSLGKSIHPSATAGEYSTTNPFSSNFASIRVDLGYALSDKVWRFDPTIAGAVP